MISNPFFNKMLRPLERGRRSSEGLAVSRYRSIIVGNEFQRLITEPEKLTPRVIKTAGRWRQEMKLLKKSSHAGMMPRVEIKFNINMQFIAHKLVYGFVLILWLIVSAWPS